MKPKHFGGRGHKIKWLEYGNRRLFARQRHGICRWCGHATTVTAADIFGPCCGEPTGLFNGPNPTPWKIAR